VKARTLVIVGGIAAAGGALYYRVRRRQPQPKPDPAADLRQKLDESRAVVEERDEFESAEVPVDQADPGIDARRRELHERARSSIEEMGEPKSD
jgi:hypothetical protein